MNEQDNDTLAKAVRRRRMSFAMLVVSLTAIAAAMAVLLAVTLDAAGRDADPARRDGLTRLALMALALLCLVLLLLIWAVIRYIVFRTRPSGQRSRTPYVDAWSLAGQRLKLRQRSVEEGEEDEQGDSDEADEDEPPDRFEP